MPRLEDYSVDPAKSRLHAKYFEKAIATPITPVASLGLGIEKPLFLKFMSEKFLNSYRIPTARWQDWNYNSPAAYFITICTHNREHYFGEIEEGEVHLSTIGKIVETQWLKTPEVRPDMNLTLDEFVVMPNHFHGILIIGENEFNKGTTDGLYDKKMEHGHGDGRDAMHNDGRDAMHGIGRDAMHGVSTNEPIPPTSTKQHIPRTKNKFGPQIKNLGSVIRGFKSSVTKDVKKLYSDGRDAMHGDGGDARHGVSTASITAPFAWQPRFHDHIIRDAESLDRIRQYIANNPLNWKEDKFYEGK